MSVLIGFLIFVEVVLGLLLILLVLLQRSKDEGLGMAFGNAMGESLFGAQAATILTKGTIWLAALFMVNTVVIDRLYSRGSTRTSSGIMERLNEQPAGAPAPVEAVPAVPAEEAPAPAASEPLDAPFVPQTAPAPAAAAPAPAPAAEATAPAAAPAAPAPAPAAPAPAPGA